MVQKEILGLGLALIVMFVMLFTVSKVASVIPDSDKLEYSYTGVANSTSTAINSTSNATHLVYVGTLESITGEATPTKTLQCNFTSTNVSSQSVAVYLNGTLLGNVTVANQTTTSSTFSNVAFAGGTANITYELATADTKSTVKVDSSFATYPSDFANSWVGTTFDSLTTNTGTIYDLMVLVIIVAGLAIALFYLGNFNRSVAPGSAI